jgi:hypothetical protein
MTTLKRILNILINGSQSPRDSKAMIEHRDMWLGKQSRVVANAGRHYSF